MSQAGPAAPHRALPVVPSAPGSAFAYPEQYRDHQVDQVEIQVGHLCNNRCVFCTSGHITSLGLAEQSPGDPVLDWLAEGARRGAWKVTFVGGEPTLQRELPGWLAAARAQGFREIVLFTNGVRTHQAAYLDELLAGGPLVFRISVQGGTEEAHDRVTGRVGAFGRIVAGMRLMRARGQRIQVNACLNLHSYQSVAGYAELAARFGVEHVHLDQVNPRDIGNRPEGYLDEILVDYARQAPFLAEMLRRFERALGPDYPVHLGNLPFCLLPGFEHRIHHAGERTMVVSANVGELAPTGHDKYERKVQGRIKPPSCADCALDGVCTGMFSEVAERFGTEGLRPVPLARLAAQPSAVALFTLVEAERLQRLRAAPPGFELAHVECGPRDAEARFTWAAPGGGAPVTLALRHARAPGVPVLTVGAVAVHPVGPLEASALPVLAWVAATLGAPGPLEARDVRARAAHGEGSRRLLAQVVARGVAAGAVSIPAPTPDAATLVVGEGEAAVRVRLELTPAFQRPRLRAELQPAAPGQRAVAERAAAALRGWLGAAPAPAAP